MSTPLEFAQAAQAFITTIQAAVTDPADAVQVFTQLTVFPVDPSTLSPIGRAQATLNKGISDLCRRQAVCALAQSASYYQPSSYDDAARLRDAVCEVIDREILIAGDQGEDASYTAMVQLRLAVVQDLTTRGATLAPLTTVKMQASLPSLVLAYMLYQDISRADQLINFANPPHPAFMPVQFQALAS